MVEENLVLGGTMEALVNWASSPALETPQALETDLASDTKVVWAMVVLQVAWAALMVGMEAGQQKVARVDFAVPVLRVAHEVASGVPVAMLVPVAVLVALA